MKRKRPSLTWLMPAAWILPGFRMVVAPADAQSWTPVIPKTWDEAALADWATPVAGLNVRPTHISASEYYSLAVDNLRTYPVYFPAASRRATGRCCSRWALNP